MQEGAGQPRSLRTRVYVDGYNFYYGCLKGTRHKWLDLYKLFQEHVLPSALIERDGQPVRSELLAEALQFFKDQKRLVRFLDQYAASMPRVILRYATEKLPVATRKKYLATRA